MDLEDELSEEMVGKLDTFEESLNNLETTLKPFLRIPVNDTNEKIDDPLLKARLDLMVAYSINSLFWGYLCTQGINAKNHPIRNELKRVQDYMSKVKLAEEKKKMARVDTHAAKRFIRNALWEKPECSNQGDDTKNDSDELETDRGADKLSKHDDSDEPEKDVPVKKAKLDNEQQNGGDEVVPKKKKKKKNKKNGSDELETDKVVEKLSKNDDCDKPENDVPAKKAKLENEQQNGEDEVVPKKSKKKKNKKSGNDEKRKKKKKKEQQQDE